jgi:hypothetical protein
MRTIGKLLLAVVLLAVGGVAGFVVATRTGGDVPLKLASNDTSTTKTLKFQLVPSSDQLRKCMPHAKVNVRVELTTDEVGFDTVKFDASGLPPKTSFTAFLLEVPASPFGSAEYFVDVDSDKYGKAHVEAKLIAEEAFSSTLVGKDRIRKELNHMGMWFADPADDDFCFGKGKGAVTPFDGDDEAGVQAFNSANALPGAPLP